MQAGVILKEQPKPDSVQLIADLLSRLARLYQIPNWTPLASVELAEWTYDNYKFEGPETIIKALTNPPAGSDRTWRLTPDTIAEWITKELEALAVEREREALKLKEVVREELPGIDYNAFQKRILKEGIPKDEPAKERVKSMFEDPEYLKVKDQYVREKIKSAAADSPVEPTK